MKPKTHVGDNRIAVPVLLQLAKSVLGLDGVPAGPGSVALLRGELGSLNEGPVLGHGREEGR